MICLSLPALAASLAEGACEATGLRSSCAETNARLIGELS